MSEDDKPRTYEECPICHCPGRIVEAEVNLEKAAGKILPERIPCSNLKLIPILDPTRSTLIFPVLMVHFDYCDRCGYEYPHVITKQKMTIDQLQSLLMAQAGMTGMTPRGQG